MRGFVNKALVIFGLVAIGCSNPLTAGSIVGTYRATTFVLPIAGDLVNDAGGTFTITLNADGTTAGSLFVPGVPLGGVFPGDLNETLDGTFAVVHGSLMFMQAAGGFFSFFSDLTWSVDGEQISGEGMIQDIPAYMVVLRRE